MEELFCSRVEYWERNLTEAVQLLKRGHVIPLKKQRPKRRKEEEEDGKRKYQTSSAWSHFRSRRTRCIVAEALIKKYVFELLSSDEPT